ncbi:MAG: DUF4390 domain-containing protein [Deltaproteobacteria bacterium]|nr:DUF4390 domain-containing protein [Deltaproteobacteria bacterium]
MRKRKLFLSGVIVTWLLLFLISPSWAEGARIRDLLVTNNANHLLVYARVTDCFTKEMENAILAGVPTTFTFLLDLYQERSYWFDKKLLRVTVQHTIKYDNVKKIFYVSVNGEKEPASFPDLESAKRAMADLNGVSVVPLSSVKRGEYYYVQLKAKLDKVRLPFYMEYVFFFVSLWDFETDWHREGFYY